MPDLDQVLAPLLDHPLAEPEPMAGLERRAGRVRRARRLRLAGAAAAAAAAAIAVVFAVAGGDDGQLVRTIPPANDPSGPPTPHTPQLDNLARLGGITVEGEAWDILAGPDELTSAALGQPSFCSGLRKGPVTTSGCGPSLEPGEVFDVAAPQDLGIRRPEEPPPAWVLEHRPPFLYGFVAKDVATIRLQLQDGTTVDAAPTGAEAGLPFNVYAVPIPPGAVPETMLALAPDGRELGRRDYPFWPPAPPPPCLPPPMDRRPCAPVAVGSSVPPG